MRSPSKKARWKTQAMVEHYAHIAPEGLQMAASRLDNHLSQF
jgi:hypothetical protein